MGISGFVMSAIAKIEESLPIEYWSSACWCARYSVYVLCTIFLSRVRTFVDVCTALVSTFCMLRYIVKS